MATVELDPQFIKALRLLRSKSKDSGAQLRAMLDEAIRFKTRQLIILMTMYTKILIIHRQKKGLSSGDPRSPSVGKQHSEL